VKDRKRIEIRKAQLLRRSASRRAIKTLTGGDANVIMIESIEEVLKKDQRMQNLHSFLYLMYKASKCLASGEDRL